MINDPDINPISVGDVIIDEQNEYINANPGIVYAIIPFTTSGFADDETENIFETLAIHPEPYVSCDGDEPWADDYQHVVIVHTSKGLQYFLDSAIDRVKKISSVAECMN